MFFSLKSHTFMKKWKGLWLPEVVIKEFSWDGAMHLRNKREGLRKMLLLFFKGSTKTAENTNTLVFL